jgi:hypothetical protein
VEAVVSKTGQNMVQIVLYDSSSGEASIAVAQDLKRQLEDGKDMHNGYQ